MSPPEDGPASAAYPRLLPVKEWDIFLGLLWNRFGSPAGEKDEHGKPMTGTEEEFKLAYQAWKESGKKRPWIAVYRCEHSEVTKGKGAQIAEVDNLAKLEDEEAYTIALRQFHG